MAESSQPESTKKKIYRIVEVMDEELQQMLRAGLSAQVLQALIEVTDEELQQMQLKIDLAKTAERERMARVLKLQQLAVSPDQGAMGMSCSSCVAASC